MFTVNVREVSLYCATVYVSNFKLYNNNDNLSFMLIRIHTYSLFVIFSSRFLIKYNVRVNTRGTPSKLFTYYLSCVHHSLCTCSSFALAHSSLFISTHQIPFRVRSTFKWERRTFHGLWQESTIAPSFMFIRQRVLN